MKFFKTRKTRQKRNITLINVDKELKVLLDIIHKWINSNVQNVASYMEELINDNTNINHIPAVAKLKESFQSKLNEIGVIYDRNMSLHRTTYNKYLENFGGNAPNKEADKQKEIDDLSTEKDRVLDGASDGHKKDMDDTEKIIERLEVDEKRKVDHLKSLPRHKVVPRKVACVALLGLMILAEIYMTSDTYEIIGFFSPASHLIGFGIAMASFSVSGIGLVRVWRNNDYGMVKKILITLVITAIACLVYHTLGTIRSSQMGSEDSLGLIDISPFSFMTFNLLILAGMFFTKYHLYPTKKMIEDNAAYSLAKQDLTQCKKQLKYHKNRFFNGYKLESKKREQVNKQFNTKIKLHQKEISVEVAGFRTSAVEFNTELAKARNFYVQINSDYRSSVALLFNSIPQYIDGKAFALDMDALNDLKNPFDGIELLATNENAAKPAVQTVVQINGSSERTAWDISAESQNGETDYPFTNTSK